MTAIERKERAEWLAALRAGDNVRVYYRDSIIPTVVHRDRPKFVWCMVNSFEIRFRRKTGEQWGGGMILLSSKD